MNAKEVGKASLRGMDSVAESVVMRFVARAGMALATLVLLPFLAFVGHRLVGAFDGLQTSVQVLSGEQALSTQAFGQMQEQYGDLKKEIAKQGAEIYLRSDADKAWDWQKVRDAGQDADRRDLEVRLGKRIDSEDQRLLNLEGHSR